MRQEGRDTLTTELLVQQTAAMKLLKLIKVWAVWHPKFSNMDLIVSEQNCSKNSSKTKPVSSGSLARTAFTQPESCPHARSVE